MTALGNEYTSYASFSLYKIGVKSVTSVNIGPTHPTILITKEQTFLPSSGHLYKMPQGGLETTAHWSHSNPDHKALQTTLLIITPWLQSIDNTTLPPNFLNI